MEPHSLMIRPALWLLLCAGIAINGAHAQDRAPDPAQNWASPSIDPAVAAAMRTGAFKDAAALLETRAKTGDREAQYQLASLYRSGRGVDQNDALAFKWMKSAAGQGHTKAQYSLGSMYLSGHGTNVDTVVARSWLQKAAAQGHQQALRLMTDVANTKSVASSGVTTKNAAAASTDGKPASDKPPAPMPQGMLKADPSKPAGTLPPFIDAAWRGQLKLVQRFLASNVDLEQKDRDGNTALALAAAAGHVAVIDGLVGAGANVNSTNAKGDSPLLMAAAKGKLEAASHLISAKADLKAKNISGASVLDITVAACSNPLLDVLIKAGEVQKQTANSDRLLLQAAAHCDASITAALLRGGVNINASNDRGQSAAWIAADSGNAGALRLLVDAGANLDSADTSGDTPLMRALARGGSDAAAALLPKTSAAVVQNASGNTPLMLAAKSNMKDAVAALLKAKAPLNARNANGYSALMIAAQEGHAEIAKLLIDAGADQSLRNKKREQASDIASVLGHADVLKVLTP